MLLSKREEVVLKNKELLRAEEKYVELLRQLHLLEIEITKNNNNKKIFFTETIKS
jgi:hypothetical protein